MSGFVRPHFFQATVVPDRRFMIVIGKTI